MDFHTLGMADLVSVELTMPLRNEKEKKEIEPTEYQIIIPHNKDKNARP